MLNNKYYLGSYYKEDSRIHKLNPKIKVLTLLIIFIALIISKSIHNIILLNLYILTMILYSNISLKIYIKHLLNYKLGIIIIFLITLIITRNISLTIYITIKLIDILLLLITLIMTTTPLEINYGLTSLLENRIVNFNKLILNITLSIIALPIARETKEQIHLSRKVRGLEKNKPTNKERLKLLIDNIEPTYRITKNKLKRISTTMEIKNYSYSSHRTNYKEKKNKLDIIVLLLNIIIFILVIIY